MGKRRLDECFLWFDKCRFTSTNLSLNSKAIAVIQLSHTSILCGFINVSYVVVKHLYEGRDS